MPAAFADAVRQSMRPIRAAIGAATINPELLTSAERLQYVGRNGTVIYLPVFGDNCRGLPSNRRNV